MKKSILLLFALIGIFVSAGSAKAAEGDLIWEKTGPYSTPPWPCGYASAVAVDASAVYITGVNSMDCGYGDTWIQKRSLNDGSLIWQVTAGYSNTFSTGIAVDSTGVYMSGGNSFGASNNGWWTEKRSLADGSLIWTYTGTGFSALDIAVDATGVYLVGGQVASPYALPRWEKRSLSNGGLIWARTGGIMMYVPGGDVKVNPTGMYTFGLEASSLYGGIGKKSLNDGSGIWSMDNGLNYGTAGTVGMAIDATGVYFAGGSASGGTIEKRGFDGSLTWQQATSVTGGTHFGLSLAGNRLYVAYGGTNHRWIIEERNSNDGSLVWSRIFDVGIASCTIQEGRRTWVECDDFPYNIAADSTGIYTVGVQDFGYYYPDDVNLGAWRIEKRERKQPYIDCGLRFYDGSQTITIACEPAGTLTSPLRIRKDATIYGLVLVSITDPSASNFRVMTSSGIKALRKL